MTEPETAQPEPELRVIKITGSIDGPDEDPVLYPYKLHAKLSPPELMQVAFIMLHGGTEEVIIRARTFEGLSRFLESNETRKHPRLRSLVITGPEGKVLENFQR